MAHLSLPLVSHVQFSAKWHRDALTQPYYLCEGFPTHQFDFAFRFTM